MHPSKALCHAERRGPGDWVRISEAAKALEAIHHFGEGSGVRKGGGTVGMIS